MFETLTNWSRYAPNLAALMRAEIARISAQPELSNNLRELVDRALGESA
jgi:hypothetical protein